MDNNDVIFNDFKNRTSPNCEWIYRLLLGDSIDIVDLVKTIQFLYDKDVYFHQFIISEFRKLNIVRVSKSFLNQHDNLRYAVYVINEKNYLVFANIRTDILIPITLRHNDKKECRLINFNDYSKKNFSWLIDFELSDEIINKFNDGFFQFTLPKLEGKSRKELMKFIDKHNSDYIDIVKISLEIRKEISILKNPIALFLSSSTFK
jgi:hypothetical protein